MPEDVNYAPMMEWHPLSGLCLSLFQALSSFLFIGFDASALAEATFSSASEFSGSPPTSSHERSSYFYSITGTKAAASAFASVGAQHDTLSSSELSKILKEVLACLAELLPRSRKVKLRFFFPFASVVPYFIVLQMFYFLVYCTFHRTLLRAYLRQLFIINTINAIKKFNIYNTHNQHRILNFQDGS
jgi:hypothetical protein